MLNVKLKNSEDLLKVFRTVESILSVNKIDNKLKFVKLSNEKNRLKITARNPFMRLEYLTDVNSIDGDVALYDYKTLNSLLNVIQGDIAITDGAIDSAKCSYKIPCVDGEGYPEDILPNIDNTYELNTNEFKEALNNVSIATDKASNATYAILSGVYIGENKIMASDSKRVFMQEITIGEEFNGLVLPKELVSEVPRLPFGDKLSIAVFGENIIVRDNNITLSCVKLADKYPKIECLLPKEVKNEITINRDELQNALYMVAPIIDEDTRACALEYRGLNMQVKVDSGLNKAKTNIAINSNASENINVKFNIQFLLDMLKVNSEKINVKTYYDNIGYMFSSGKSKQYIIPLIN